MARKVLSASGSGSGTGGSATFLPTPIAQKIGGTNSDHYYCAVPYGGGFTQVNQEQFGVTEYWMGNGQGGVNSVSFQAFPFQVNSSTGAITFGTRADVRNTQSNNVTTGYYNSVHKSTIPGYVATYGRAFTSGASYWYYHWAVAQFTSGNTVSVSFLNGSTSTNSSWPDCNTNFNQWEWGNKVCCWAYYNSYDYMMSVQGTSNQGSNNFGATMYRGYGASAAQQWRDTDGIGAYVIRHPNSNTPCDEFFFRPNGGNWDIKTNETPHLSAIGQSGIAGFKYKGSTASHNRWIFINSIGHYKSYDEDGNLYGSNSNAYSNLPYVLTQSTERHVQNAGTEHPQSIGESITGVGKNLFMYTSYLQDFTGHVQLYQDGNGEQDDYNRTAIALTFLELTMDGNVPVFKELGTIADTFNVHCENQSYYSGKLRDAVYSLAGNQNQFLVKKTGRLIVQVYDISSIIDLSAYATV